MRVITLNVNGIRSAARKGFFNWLSKQNADVVCLQEIKAQEADLANVHFQPEGYHAYFHFAEKKGYSGVALYTRQKPIQVKTGLGWPCADQEGRYVEATFNDVTVISLYLPSGTSGEARQNEKFDFLKRFADHLIQLQKTHKELIICGDWNIAHHKIDLKNWRGNQKNSGFLPEERAWMDTLLGDMQFVDAFRVLNPEAEQYTWWSNRGEAWAKNVGWRIDYQIVTPGLRDKIRAVSIYKAERFSDHAPLLVDYQLID
ncbi:MAG TPA: exodeoxyribonuclease III [Gammaproteobacteria bacterium]|nr:exodeoxyribonuclease III [Gammaproteobacteria bacterium]